jgi:hypothetical protein
LFEKKYRRLKLQKGFHCVISWIRQVPKIYHPCPQAPP